jgi:Na+/H+ antiporter NhaA
MYFLTKVGIVISLVILPSCGPLSHTLFTLGGHNFTLGGMVISNTVKKVIENEQEDCIEGWTTPSITDNCEEPCIDCIEGEDKP